MQESYSLNDKDSWESLRKKLVEFSMRGIVFSLEKEEDFKRIILKW